MCFRYRVQKNRYPFFVTNPAKDSVYRVGLLIINIARLAVKTEAPNTDGLPEKLVLLSRMLLIMQPEQRINRLEFGRLKSVLFGFSAGVAAKGVVFKRFVF